MVGELRRGWEFVLWEGLSRNQEAEVLDFTLTTPVGLPVYKIWGSSLDL